MARETWVQYLVESYQRLKKWYLMPPCLTISIIRYGSMVKWTNPGKRVVPSPTPRCSSYRKGSLRVTVDYDRQLTYVYLNHWSFIKIRGNNERNGSVFQCLFLSRGWSVILYTLSFYLLSWCACAYAYKHIQMLTHTEIQVCIWVKPTQKESVLYMPLNCWWWWDSTLMTVSQVHWFLS